MDIDKNFQTPLYVCDYMVRQIPLECVTILEPTPGIGNLVGEMQSWGFSVTAPENFWDISGKFDCIVMNPPFTPMTLGYKILYRCMEMSDNIIALMPWLTLINSKKRSEKIKSFGLRSVVHLPRTVFSGSRVQTCILNMSKGYNETTQMYFYGIDVF